MEKTLYKSSIVEVLEDLQSAIDKGLNNHWIMVQTYRFKYKVDSENRLIRFRIIPDTMGVYHIIGEIRKTSDNRYSISASTHLKGLLVNLVQGIVLLYLIMSTIISDNYIIAIAIPVIFVLVVSWEYKHTNRNIKKKFSELESNPPGDFIAASRDCDFENYLDAGPYTWTYFKTPAPFIRKLKMTAIDFVAVVCVLVGLTCFFYSLHTVGSLIENGTLRKDESIRLLISTAIFLPCAFFVTMSLLSGNKRKQS